ncbi:MAG: hypothetical protein GF331_15695, partial [Chitinivibrionales bacterium]|nr:hypothetical protein [Chitinivibrionales bacterium]
MEAKYAVIAVLLSCLHYQAGAVNLSIDASIEYQTIEGFGAHGAMDVWWGQGPFYNQQFLDDIVDDLGMTMVRNEYYPPDDSWSAGPNVWENKQRDYIIALKNKAEQSGEPMRFTVTYWSPPAHFKDNNSTRDGGHVMVDKYDEFAEYAVNTVKRYKDEAGVDLYALSFANEPRFAQTYNSSVWTEEEYRDFLKVIGAKFEAQGLTTKLFGPEDVMFTFGRYAGIINQDPVARRYLGAFAVHGYVDGVNPYDGLPHWTQLKSIHDATGWPIWQTETSGYANDWPSAFLYVQNIAVGLRHGQVSAWVWWQLSSGGDGEFTLMPNSGGKGKKYYGSKHFYRYIRPGAVRIELDDSQDPDIIASAYNHRQDKTLTVVIVNSSDQTKQVTLTADVLPTTFEKYTTSSSKNCRDEGTVGGSSSITIDPRSVVTLYGDGYDTGTGVAPRR